MKKLLLASAASNTLHFLEKIVTKPLKELKVAFITTAGNPCKDTWWIEKDKKALDDLDMLVTSVDVEGMSEKEMSEILGVQDIIFVAGGNAIYLLQEAQKTAFLDITKKLVNDGVIYVGSSAGSLLAGPNLELEKYSDDRKDPPKLTSYKGLDLVNFLIQPHWTEDGLKEEYIKNADKLAESKIPLITLTDNQAVLVVGGKFEILDSS